VYINTGTPQDESTMCAASGSYAALASAQDLALPPEVHAPP